MKAKLKKFWIWYKKSYLRFVLGALYGLGFGLLFLIKPVKIPVLFIYIVGIGLVLDGLYIFLLLVKRWIQRNFVADTYTECRECAGQGYINLGLAGSEMCEECEGAGIVEV